MMLGPCPIIPGFAPDPSICRIGDTLFLVNSSFHVFPGLPIYASKDMKTWEHIGNAIHRPEQLSLRRADTSLKPNDIDDVMIATGGLYAPTIRHHQGVTYIVCTNIVHKDSGAEHAENFIIHTTDIWSGKWSDPVYYNFQGIDPSILFDDDGKVYIQISKTPDFQIYNFEIDIGTGKMLTEPKLIWKGWDRRWTEGPHVYQRDGWYYLLCAEGGTFEFHMVSMARSRSIWGPYEEFERNPIWTAYGTPSYVQHTGHADLFQNADGTWGIVMLGVRFLDQRYVMGRETFLAALTWPEGGWPSVQGAHEVEEEPEDGSVVLSAANDTVEWVYLRDPNLGKYRIEGKEVIITASKFDLAEPNESVSFVGKRQRRLRGHSEVGVTGIIDLAGHAICAGLALYKDEHRFLAIGLDFARKKVCLQGLNKAKAFSVWKEHPADDHETVSLRISYTETSYTFAFREGDHSDWIPLGVIDTMVMTGTDFTGPLIGMYCVGDETAKVKFQSFKAD